MIESAHDVSDGGLAVTLTEAAVMGDRGVKVEVPITGRWDAALFGEAQSRIVVTVSSNNTEVFEALIEKNKVPALWLGFTGGNRIVIGDLVDVALSDAADMWENGFETATRD